ncbi:MAG: hypothetical protein ACE5FS_10720 [Paracoccaceae bacterium]
MSRETADRNEKIAVLTASPVRRMFGAGLMAVLGALMFYVAIAASPDNELLLALLIAVGAVAVWQAARLYRATRHGLYLTREGLYESTGTRLCTVAQIASVDRGFFAFKPSNGFLIRLKEPMPRVWKPGLYWRFGRRIGVGGTTSPRQGKEMADIISLLIADNDAGRTRR